MTRPAITILVTPPASLLPGDVTQCSRCRGAGDVRAPGPAGTLRRIVVCPACEGAGFMPIVEAYGEAGE